jgi:hypothetical protein
LDGAAVFWSNSVLPAVLPRPLRISVLSTGGGGGEAAPATCGNSAS